MAPPDNANPGGAGAQAQAAAPAPAAGQAAAPGQLIETQLTTELWFVPTWDTQARNHPAYANGTPDLMEWLRYWRSKLEVGMTPAQAIDRATRHLSPKAKTHYVRASVGQKIATDKTSFDAFKVHCRKVFQVTQADTSSHPLRSLDWFRQTAVNPGDQRPKNHLLRLQCADAYRTIQQFGLLVNGSPTFDKHLPSETANRMFNHLKLLGEIKAVNPNAAGQLDENARAWMIAGAAIYTQLDAIKSFQLQNVPATTGLKLQDAFEKRWDNRQPHAIRLEDEAIDELCNLLADREADVGEPLLRRLTKMNQLQSVMAVGTSSNSNGNNGRGSWGNGRGGRRSRGSRGRRNRNNQQKGDTQPHQPGQQHRNGGVAAISSEMDALSVASQPTAPAEPKEDRSSQPQPSDASLAALFY